MKSVIHTTYGPITLELLSGRCELTVANFTRYVNDGFYDGTMFHRVIDGFIVQGGGFERGLIQKATRPPIANESAEGLSNDRGTVAMARLPDEPASATAQFFINMHDNISLNHQYAGDQDWGYCAFARVVDGMRFADRISKIGTRAVDGYRDVPVEEIVIERVELLH